MPERPLDRGREFLKDTIRQQIDFSQTDQSRASACRRWKSRSRTTPNGSTCRRWEVGRGRNGGPGDGHRRSPQPPQLPPRAAHPG